MLSRRRILKAGGLLIGLAFPMLQGQADAGTLLEAGGKVRTPADEAVRRYTFAGLEALGLTTLRIATPWYDQPCSFEGVLLSRLMEDCGAVGDTVRVTALDDYSADLPVSDIAEHRPLLALRRNGQTMPLSDKGPLFLVYDYDAFPATERQLLLSRSVWQVNRIDVL